MKKIITVLSTFIILFSLNICAFAQSNTENTSNFNTQETPTSQDSKNTSTENMYGPSTEYLDDLTPDVNMTDAEDYIDEKGFELIGLFQKVAQIFVIISFIFCGFMALAGAFGNGQLVGKGLWGMALTAVIFAVITYAPELLDAFVAWTAS